MCVPAHSKISKNSRAEILANFKRFHCVILLGFGSVNWQRSLYWRIATGVIGFLAAMLVVEIVVYVWAVAESGRTLPGGSSLQFAQSIAQDVSAAIEVAPDLDIAHYLNEEY